MLQLLPAVLLAVERKNLPGWYRVAARRLAGHQLKQKIANLFLIRTSARICSAFLIQDADG
jgi:hypothetical protein